MAGEQRQRFQRPATYRGSRMENLPRVEPEADSTLAREGLGQPGTDRLDATPPSEATRAAAPLADEAVGDRTVLRPASPVRSNRPALGRDASRPSADGTSRRDRWRDTVESARMAEARREAPEVPAREPRGRSAAPGARMGLLRLVLLFLAWACRLAAIVLAVLVVMGCFSFAYRLRVVELSAMVAEALPAFVSGLYVINTPFGGVFRGDFALVSVTLFVLDWILLRVRYSLRRRDDYAGY